MYVLSGVGHVAIMRPGHHGYALGRGWTLPQWGKPLLGVSHVLVLLLRLVHFEEILRYGARPVLMTIHYCESLFSEIEDDDALVVDRLEEEIGRDVSVIW